MRTPVVLVTGVDADSMAATTVGLQFDLPFAVVVRHTLDVESQLLTRMVSDLGGVVEHESTDLEHACVSCALREDIVPTLERLAASGRWGAIVAHLPVSAEAMQVCRVIESDRRIAPHVRISAVVTAVDGSRALEDLTGDELLVERDLHTSDEDRRGVAETQAMLVEYADAIVTSGPAPAAAIDLLRALARPGAILETDPSHLDGAALVQGVHVHARTEAWVDVVRRGPLPQRESTDVWTLDLASDRPFHPGRLLERIEQLGGDHRSRGCFWLPTRPDEICVWEGAGGQLSVGTAMPWGPSRPLTRIVVTGVGPEPEDLAATFASCLVTPDEIGSRGTIWEAVADGLEPWLGEIRRAA